MSKALACYRLFGVFVIWSSAICPTWAQEILIPGKVMVVNMIHPSQGHETRRDSEPNLAVNPANPLEMAATAFTPDPGGSKAPLYRSSDGGRNWEIQSILPFNDSVTGTGDITLRFGSTSGVLYVAALEKPAYDLRIFRSGNFFTSAPSVERLTSYTPVDQPYVEAISVPVASGATEDRVFVGYSDLRGAGRRTATIQLLANAAVATAPMPIVQKRLEKRNTCEGETDGFDGPTRVSVHPDGKVYGAFFRYTAGCGTELLTADIVVARDLNWGDGPDPFSDLKDASDGVAGVVVATGVKMVFTKTSNPSSPRLGKQRIGGHIFIAVDPADSERVVLAWADGDSPETYAIHVRQSTDGGKTWSADIKTVTKAVNPSLAINSRGTVGLLYQKFVTCAAADGCWETRLEMFRNDAGYLPSNLLLHRAPDNIGGLDVAGPLGEYNHLMAIEADFYGIFSGNNTPDDANFPHGVTYRRNASFSSDPAVSGKLFASDGTTTVAASVDPFFFIATEPLRLDRCTVKPWLCDFNPAMERGLLKLKCLMHGCTVVDLVPRNCPVKFKCPGCAPGGLCPPYYHLHLGGLKGAWRVGLLDSAGLPVAHRQFKTQSGLVVSFQPTKDKFVQGRIGSYLLAFEMGTKGEVGTEYRVKARLTRASKHYEPVAKPPR